MDVRQQQSLRYYTPMVLTMTTTKKYSPLIRTTTGVLGLFGVAAIGFDAVKNGSIQLDLMLFVRLLAGFIFLYVAIFGTSPLEFSGSSDDET